MVALPRWRISWNEADFLASSSQSLCYFRCNSQRQSRESWKWRWWRRCNAGRSSDLSRICSWTLNWRSICCSTRLSAWCSHPPKRYEYINHIRPLQSGGSDSQMYSLIEQLISRDIYAAFGICKDFQPFWTPFPNVDSFVDRARLPRCRTSLSLPFLSSSTNLVAENECTRFDTFQEMTLTHPCFFYSSFWSIHSPPRTHPPACNETLPRQFDLFAFVNCTSWKEIKTIYIHWAVECHWTTSFLDEEFMLWDNLRETNQFFRSYF